MGYQRNEYDWCVMKKNVKGKQCNIIQDVEDLNMFHIYPDIVSGVLSDIDADYVNIEKVTMVTGGACVQSRKQKLNTKRSTQAKLVRVDYVLTQVVWTKYFLKDQGYEIHDNVIYQNNQSAIKLENNGRHSSIKQTNHTNIRYYFITDTINKQEEYV